MTLDNKKKYTKHIPLCRQSIDNLIVEKKIMRIVNHCLSPIWDTGWMGHVLLEQNKNVDDLVTWFLNKEIKTAGDWNVQNKILHQGDGLFNLIMIIIQMWMIPH